MNIILYLFVQHIDLQGVNLYLIINVQGQMLDSHLVYYRQDLK